MKNFDYSKLKGRIKEKGYTQMKLSMEIGISQCWLCKKLNNDSEFTQSQIFKICKILDIQKDEIDLYFFCLKS